MLERIRSGELLPVSPAPSTRRLASEIGCNEGTVLRAYTRLTARGHLVRNSSGFRVLGDARTDPHSA